MIITRDNFEQEVLNSPIPVLLKFGAEWCKPCQVMKPTLEQIAEEQVGKIKVGEVDIDSNSDLASMYNIRSVPTVLIFSNGQIINRTVGAVSKETLLSKVTGV